MEESCRSKLRRSARKHNGSNAFNIAPQKVKGADAKISTQSQTIALLQSSVTTLGQRVKELEQQLAVAVVSYPGRRAFALMVTFIANS